jgi:hypothetical protein
MAERHISARQEMLVNTIAESMEELKQLHTRPTLDDFQDFRRKKLEFALIDLRLELQALETRELIGDGGPHSLPRAS